MAERSPLLVPHLVVRMPNNSLYSARGVRFKENILTKTFTANESCFEEPWPSSSNNPAFIPNANLVTFSFLMSERADMTSCKQQLRRELEKLFLHHGGLLFGTREKGVLFPVFHLSYEALPMSKKSNHESLPDGFLLYQGIYRKVRNIVHDIELPQQAAPPTPSPPLQQCNIGYILLGFKSLDRHFSQVMVDTWKDWTGARYICMNLPDDLGLRRITFYHRQKPDSLEFFMYLVVVECYGITSKEKQLHLLDFTQRMRLERMSGYISVYSAEAKDSVPEESIEHNSTTISCPPSPSFLANTTLPRNTRA